MLLIAKIRFVGRKWITYEYGAFVEWHWKGKTEVFKEKPDLATTSYTTNHVEKVQEQNMDFKNVDIILPPLSFATVEKKKIFKLLYLHPPSLNSNNTQSWR